MLYPSIDELIEKTGSKYMLVVAASRRARMLREGIRPRIDNPQSAKPIGCALEEIYRDEVQFAADEQ
ncbi:MAG: DNA-directed RNA polymerase subunit omega [Paenibacillaceae bacterium]|jgi:DNA-directed RNA polymerase subunit omega|nr:DNA-directed RNA polymerase subunit omega [Paenibacillaceae bacterium]